MDIAEAVAFVRDNHNAVLGTLKPDGTPQLSPVTVGVDAAGRLLISTRETAVKTKHLRRDPRAFLAVFTTGFYGPWVQLSGPAEVVALPDALPLLEGYYRDISGEHPDWAEYRQAMIDQQRVMVRITPEAAGPNVSG